MSIESETKSRFLAQVRSLDAGVSALRRSIDAEPLATADRQYLSRCFDLIDLELGVLREYIEQLGGGYNTHPPR